MAQLSQEAEDRIVQIDQRLQYLIDLSMRHGQSDEIIQEKEDLELEKASIHMGQEITTVKAKRAARNKAKSAPKAKTAKAAKKPSAPKKK